MTRIDAASFAEMDSDQPLADAARNGGDWKDGQPLKAPNAADLRRLEDYIKRDETSLARQRAILAECDGAGCDGPARAIAEATVAEYEQSLEALYRRRSRLLARS